MLHFLQAFVFLVHSCTAFRCVMLFTLLSYNLKNPLNYFEIARTTLSASLCWFFIWTLWMKQGICKEILHRLANLNYFPNVTMFKLQWVRCKVIKNLIASVASKHFIFLIIWIYVCRLKIRLLEFAWCCFMPPLYTQQLKSAMHALPSFVKTTRNGIKQDFVKQTVKLWSTNMKKLS